MKKFLLRIKDMFMTRRTVIPDLIILLALATIPFLLHGRYIVFNSMIDVCIDPMDFFNRLLYLWNFKEWAGTSFGWGTSFLFPITFFFAFLSFFKLSGAVVERLWFAFILFQCGISMYYLMFVLFGEKYRLARLISAIAYMYNLYVFIGLQGASVLLLPYSVLPLMLGLYIRGISTRNYLKFGILFGLTFTIMSFMSPPLVVANIVVLAFYSFYHIFVVEGRKGLFPVVKTATSSLLFSLALHLWIILPTIYYLRSSYLMDMSSIFSEKLTWINSGSSFLETFRLLGIWYFFGYGAPGVMNFTYSTLFKDNGFFIFLSFLLPILSLFALTIKRGSKYLIFFGLLILFAIPMAVGIYPPDNPSLTGKIYLWAYQKIPSFNIFKDNYRPFVAMIALSYSVLLGYLANFLFLHLKENLFEIKQKCFYEASKRLKLLSLIVKEIRSNLTARGRIIRLLKNEKVKQVIPWIPPVFILGAILIISFPIITGNIFYEKMKIKQIPGYWYESAKWINDQKEDFRIFFLPEQRRALYLWSHTAGEISLSLYQKSQIFTVASIAERPNVETINQIYKSITRDSTLDTAKMAGFMNIKYILQRNDYDWGLSVKGESPEYVKSILESKDNISLRKSFGQLDFYQVSDKYFLPHFFVPKRLVSFIGDRKNLPEVLGWSSYEPRTSIFFPNINGSAGKLDDGLSSLIGEPDEIFIKADLKNGVLEEELENSANYGGITMPESLSKPGTILYYLEEKEEESDIKNLESFPLRLFEKYFFYSQKKIAVFNLYGNKISDGLRFKLIKDYEENILSVIDLLEKLKSGSNEDYLIMSRRLKGILGQQNKKLGKKITDGKTERLVNKTFRQFYQKIEKLKIEHDFSKLINKLEIPKSGEYEIYIKDYGQTSSLNNQISNLKNEFISTDSGQKVNFGEWEFLGESYFEKGEREYFLDNPDYGKNLVSDNLKISEYSPDTIFKISFKYNNPEGRSSFSINEGSEGKLVDYSLSPTANGFEPVEVYFRSSNGAAKAFVNFSVLGYKDLKVEKIRQPQMMLRAKKTNYSNTDTGENVNFDKETPKITFFRVNPTKYKVRIEGAKNPYFLVFNESYDKGWKAYVNQTQNSKLKTQNYYGEVVASYFDGEVKEGTHKNIFLDRNTFETLGKKPISDEKHLLVNSYANSWYITPKDVGGERDYELIIEFEPQRLFYLGIFISLVAFLGCSVCLMLVLKKEHEKN